MTTAPYYQADGITLWHGDCLTITDWLGADVLLTDPPYGMKYRSRTGATVVGDGSAAVRDAALTAWGPDRPALAFGTWRAPRPEGVRELLIWWKDNNGASSGNTSLPFGPTHEEIYLLGTNWDGAPPGRRIGSVLRITVCMGNPNGPAARLGHPTPKPVNLMERLIGKCPPGTIADPFAGSGSTLIAARNQGRPAIGVEIEERYCELIARRLSQGTLFTGDTA